MKTNGNDVAFPTNQTVNDCDGNFMATVSHSGMSKREYFAALAMQGLLSSIETIGDGVKSFEDFAELSVTAADDLIKALNKEKD